MVVREKGGNRLYYCEYWSDRHMAQVTRPYSMNVMHAREFDSLEEVDEFLAGLKIDPATVTVEALEVRVKVVR
jgi:hypothetical protein